MMDTPLFSGSFQNISQRAAFSYLRSLAAPLDQLPEGLTAASVADLYGFFHAFYTGLYERPECFGLPLAEDYAVVKDEGTTKSKAEANRRLKKPREAITKGLEFLLLAGCTGRVEGQELLLEPSPADGSPQPVAAYLKKWRAGRKFLDGLQEFAGLVYREEGDPAAQGGRAALLNPRFPAMMPALRALAISCAEGAPARGGEPGEDGEPGDAPGLGSFLFARCDLRALEPGYQPQPPDLYHVFNPDDCERLARLHEYFTGRGYKAIPTIYGIHAWEVKYQGRRDVKSTPLYQMEFQDRMANPLKVYIKCASLNRIAPLVARQPQFLQDDFFTRIIRCRGDDCGWCYNKKALGPSELVRNGETITSCWYTRPDVDNFNEDSVALIQQYALMHEELAAAG